jgi:hypothetical protein
MDHDDTSHYILNNLFISNGLLDVNVNIRVHRSQSTVGDDFI